ncbi:EFNB [Lepeophtheirus salmonis]|uniref:EFNB n=1 Tax=Lepeophtheirus salmonis TaxID=72036 RepID=A0A7R8CIN9_LEPSM|nr:EFNB [Lepeophtheirus salmonis]CAF2833220.1 EFNB [Lepeophtheirus salmonis]
MNKIIITLRVLLALTAFPVSSIGSKNIFYIHWNRANPMFRQDNRDHIVEVNKGNQQWEYDQVNLICPTSKPGTSLYPETHVIYSVSKEEYETCRITNPNPRIVAVCNSPFRLLYFTLTFRSFTPIPGGLEFKPGHNYYFLFPLHPPRICIAVWEDDYLPRKTNPLFESFDNRRNNDVYGSSYYSSKKASEYSSRFLYAAPANYQPKEEILSNHIEEAQKFLSNDSSRLMGSLSYPSLLLAFTCMLYVSLY